MATNKKTRDVIALVAVIIAFAVVILSNLLADRKFSRIDLTGEGRFSLSDSFKRILSKLETTATITYYVPMQVPASFEPYKRDLLDKLNEIKTAANGKIKLDVVDPTTNKELRERLQKDQFERKIQEIKKDQVSLTNIYSGLEISYQDKPKAKIPVIFDAGQLEYAIGSQIVELTLSKKPIIAIQSPPPPIQPPSFGGQRPQSGEFDWIKNGFWEDAKKFDLRPVDLTEGNSIPPDTALFVLVRPKALTERQRFEIVRYLASGGKVLLLASPFKISRDFVWRAEKSPLGLEDYLKETGISFDGNFVADNSNLELPDFDRNARQFVRLRLPYFIRIQAENIEQQSVLTRLMPGLVMPFAAEIKLDAGQAEKLGLKTSILAKTSKQSWSIPFKEEFDPIKVGDYNEETQPYDGSKNVFVLLEGQFPFPYEGKPAPRWNPLPTDPAALEAEMKKDKETPPEIAAVTKSPGRLMICSAPEAFSEQYFSDQHVGMELRANYFLFQNIASTSGLGDDLVNLRVKRYETRTLDKLTGSESDNKRHALKIGLIAGPAALVLLLALVRTGLRRAAQTRYERKFAQTIGPSSFTP